jgi:hypothetical protein
LAHALGQLVEQGLALALDVVFDFENLLALAALLALQFLNFFLDCLLLGQCGREAGFALGGAQLLFGGGEGTFAD